MIRYAIGAALALTAWSACSAEKEALLAALASGCLLDSDCEGDLVCVFRRCHQACSDSSDCPAGQRCVLGEPPTHVCLLEDETDCLRTSDCPGDMICGPDRKCRDECIEDPDCLSDQLCTQKSCALESELVDGRLPAADPNEEQACSLDSDCEFPQRCIDGACRFECFAGEDCPSGSCVQNLCAPQGPIQPSCVPGHQVECNCTPTTSGVQICEPDGMGYGACVGCMGGGTAGPCPAEPGMTDPSYVWDGPVLTSDTMSVISRIAIGPMGQTAVSGSFQASVTIGGQQLSAVSGTDAYVARFDPTGALLGVTTLDAGAGYIDAPVLAFTSSGELWIAGNYNGGTPNLGGGPLAAAPGLYLLKLNAQGTHVYSQGFTFFPQVNPSGAFLHSGSVGGGDALALAGAFYGTVNFGTGNISSPAPNVAGTLLTVFDNGGTNLFSRSFGTAMSGTDVLLTPSGDVFMTAAFNGTVDFGAGAVTSNGFDMVLAGYDPAGAYVFADLYSTGGIIDYPSPGGLALTGSGDLSMTGSYVAAYPPDFGGGSLPSGPSNVNALFELTVNGNGAHVASSAMLYASGRDLGVDALDNTLLAGTVEQSGTVGPCMLTFPAQMAPMFFRRDPNGTIDWVRSYPSQGLTLWRTATNAAGEIFAAFYASPTTPVDFGGGAKMGNYFLLELEPTLP